MCDRQRLAILKGMLDPNNALHILDKNWLIWREIWTRVDSWYDWHINHTDQAYEVIENFWKDIEFPEPKGININMMPVKYWDLDHSLPEYLHGYKHLILSCHVPRVEYNPENTMEYTDNRDKIVYLTIHESNVPAWATQRRAGLHIERPLMPKTGGKTVLPPKDVDWNEWVKSYYHCLRWGLGALRCTESGNIPLDGIYMANNISDSCQIYPVLIRDPIDFTDRHGGIGHAKDRLGVARKLKGNELVWFTDETPHESLPVSSDVNRSFFRLVVGKISVWYSQHNTSNPLGVKPDCPISDEDKFD